MPTTFALADVTFCAWKHAVDNALFAAQGCWLFDVPITELELRELFDDRVAPAIAASLLPRPVDERPDIAVAYLRSPA